MAARTIDAASAETGRPEASASRDSAAISAAEKRRLTTFVGPSLRLGRPVAFSRFPPRVIELV